MESTFSIEQAAVIIVGADAAGDPLPGAVEWVTRRLRRGEFKGYKAARRWRMRESQVEAALAKCEPATGLPEIPVMAGLTPTSRRRLAS